jgi:hypothetical protein
MVHRVARNRAVSNDRCTAVRGRWLSLVGVMLTLTACAGATGPATPVTGARSPSGPPPASTPEPLTDSELVWCDQNAQEVARAGTALNLSMSDDSRIAVEVWASGGDGELAERGEAEFLQWRLSRATDAAVMSMYTRACRAAFEIRD